MTATASSPKENVSAAARATPSATAVLLRRPAVVFSLVVLGLVGLLALFGPSLLPAGVGEPSRDNAEQFLPPLAHGHLLGTDLNGRDLLYRVFIGARISLLVGLSGALVALFVGTSYGLISGYLGGRADAVMMRLVDVLYAIPRLIFILILVTVV
ncbi:MAG: peptide ABC transporter permease, partial [Verrucomicrobia bacterium]|nr:peptide ABC transporter permease [Verrucomicrobiota bacterium]